jgi:hypothetical protein
VLAGTIEVWVERKKRILAPGLRVRASWGRAGRLQRGPGRGQGSADLGPSVGGMGIEIVDGSGKAPWRNKRMVPFATPRINRRQRACFRFYKRSSRKQASCTRNVFKGHQAEVNQVSALAANADVPEEQGNYRA